MPFPSSSRSWRLLLSALLFPASTALAQMIPGYPPRVEAYDPRELALLPRYCLHTQDFRSRIPGGNNPQEISRWRFTMGETYEHMHHYCWGLMKQNRALLLAKTAQVRQFYFADSNDEFNYVIRNSPPDFFMLPEIFTKKGENLVRMKQGPMAIVEFERAIELKPDYWPPYAAMSDYYRDVGDIDKARDALRRGLEQSPEAPALLRRQKELGKAPDRRTES
jgi:tetratricopeptide (TPR) repeat protein